ncbi:glutamine synthetase [Xanthobacter dioxanivorans]|uniref:Glutamine synthetase n=1 Tax=Xanthobacter dioxanivorans TaxID=2528964 RepID=A0A974SI19_9HYPH|nr:glutamine synthetase family protein [Xanthobacter dioxanivorans]QRG06911.1 glutamine synthetase [Xanthobacter dioxanivorans]
MTIATCESRLLSGNLARMGLLDPNAVKTAAEVIASTKDSRLETVRILFADPHGLLRGKTLAIDALESVFRSGMTVPSTLLLKDTSNRTVFPVWSGEAGPLNGAGDVLLVPDPTTFQRLPWAHHSAWMFCDVIFKSGAEIPFAPRTILKNAVRALAEKGYALNVGLEVEFHVFQVDEERLRHSDAGLPGAPPATRLLAQGYQFLSETLYDRLEPVMDELRRHCQALGLPLRSTEVEMGPSQFEFTFDPDSPLAHADNMMRFRALVKEVCARRGLHATFMCRPRVENCAASGWHLHQSLTDVASGRNLFIPDVDNVPTALASHWIAGLLAHAEESCILTTPTVNGYKRYQPFQLAPDRIQWGLDNRGAMIRGLLNAGDTASRIENRVAETTANPYYFFASQILSGLSGIEDELCAPAPSENPYASDAKALPPSMIAAIEAFESGSLYKKRLGEGFVSYISTLKRAEWLRYLRTVSEWEHDEYFSMY